MAANKNQLLKSEKGFTLTEVTIGSALLILVAVGGLSAFDRISKLLVVNSTASTADERINEIIENIRQQPTSQIIQYSSDPQLLLKESALKMAWSNQTEGTIESCPECPGRYGYVITPISEAMGDLYLVTVLFTHKDWNQSRKFEFVVSK